MNQILHNSIQTDINELQKDIKSGMFGYLGAEIYWLRELKRITDKMAYGRSDQTQSRAL